MARPIDYSRFDKLTFDSSDSEDEKPAARPSAAPVSTSFPEGFATATLASICDELAALSARCTSGNAMEETLKKSVAPLIRDGCAFFFLRSPLRL